MKATPTRRQTMTRSEAEAQVAQMVEEWYEDSVDEDYASLASRIIGTLMDGWNLVEMRSA